MLVVVFEVALNDGCEEEYYSLSEGLQSALSKQNGFLGGTTYLCEDNPNRYPLIGGRMRHPLRNSEI